MSTSFHVQADVSGQMVIDLLADNGLIVEASRPFDYTISLCGCRDAKEKQKAYEIIKKKGWTYPEYCDTAEGRCEYYEQMQKDESNDFLCEKYNCKFVKKKEISK